MRSRWTIAAGLVLVVGVIVWLSSGASEPVRSGADAESAGVPTIVGAIPRGDAAPELDLRLATRAAVSGSVKDEKGRPIAGAQVCAAAESRWITSVELRQPRCATSGRDGRYRLEGLFPARNRVHASAPGFVPGRYARGEGAARRDFVDLRPGLEAREVDVTLRGGGVELHGVVKDLSGGAIEGAQLVSEDAFAVSGVDGAFSLWVRPGGAWVVATAEGYTTGFDDGAAPGHAFEIFLTPESVLVGQVVRADDGAPIEGARVMSGRGEGVAFTDAAGRFRLDGLEPGPYKPRVEADDATGMADASVILGLGETSAPVVIKAHPAFLVEGTIAIAGGGRCDDGSVALLDAKSGRRARGSTEADGVVRIRGVLPGDHEVTVWCASSVSAERYEHVVVEDRAIAGRVWEVERGQAIRGVVVDGAGKPVQRVRVDARPRPDPSDPRAQATFGWGAMSDASGRFEVAGLRPAIYDVAVHAVDPPRATPLKPIEVTLPKGQDKDDVRIELPATGEVRGRVRDEAGRPVAAVTVSLTDGAQWYPVTAADDGTFAFDHVAAGEYRARAQRNWSESMRAPGSSDDDVQGEKVTVAVGRAAQVELVVESVSGSLSGTVRDADGGAVSDAFIEATRESDSAAKSAGGALRDGRWGSMWDRPHLTDQDGRFTITGLPPGKYTIRAHRKGGGEGTREHVEIGGDVEVTIAETGRLSGVVAVRGGGAPPEEFSVRIEDETTGLRRNDTFFRTSAAWTFAEVPAGTYKVSVSAGDGSAQVTATMRAGEDTSGVRVELAPRVTVRGTVVDFEGRPIAGVSVSVTGAGTRSRADEQLRNVTDVEGRFEVAHAPVGAVRLSAWPRGGSQAEFDDAIVPMQLGDAAAIVEVAPIVLARQGVREGEVSGDRGYVIREAEPGADPAARRLVVAVVRAGGPAAAAGLRVGDEIVSVDGRDVRGPLAYLHDAMLRGKPGAAIVLGLARGESVRVVLGAPP